MRNHLHIGDVRTWAKTLPPQSIQTIVTSPPYWGLRAYLDADHPDKAHEMGSEPTPAAFVAALVDLFRDLRTALRDDGTLWLNLGDSYGGVRGNLTPAPDNKHQHAAADTPGNGKVGTERKNLLGIPWRVALALQADGWWLRSDIIWHKPNPMPESVTDRPTRSHEYIFLLSKRERYYYDADAIREPQAEPERGAFGKRVQLRDERPMPGVRTGTLRAMDQDGAKREYNPLGRNKRDVWTVPSAAFPGSHFATFPPDLIRPCILAGTSERGACAACGAPWRRVVARTPMVIARSERGEYMRASGQQGATSGTMLEPATSTTTGWAPSCTCTTTETRPCVVLDPFAGSGTTAQVCVEEGRDYLLCDLDERARGWLAERLAALPVARLAGC